MRDHSQRECTGPITNPTSSSGPKALNEPIEISGRMRFDDELEIETNTDRLETRLSAIIKHRPENWLSGLPQMFSPEWKEVVATLRKELKRTPTVGEAFVFLFLLDIKQRKQLSK
jgi:hypothetical protein